MVFAELLRRGEPVNEESDVVLPLLKDEELVKRIHGAAIITHFFPNLAAKVPDYNAHDSVDACRRKLKEGGLL